MNLALFHLVAYVVVGVLSDDGLFDGNDAVFSPQYCQISSPSFVLLDSLDLFSTYGGKSEPFGDCMGLPVLGASFVEDSLARVGKQKEDLLSSIACCVALKCGPYKDGYCTSAGNQCGGGVTPYNAHWCPGSYSQCCPNPERVKYRASAEDSNNLFAQENSASPDNIGREEIALGNLNLDDWTTTPLEGENLFLASDNTDNYGLKAGLGDSTGWDLESTA